MKGIKFLLFGLMFIIMGAAVLIDPSSNLGGIGELLIFAIGIAFGIKGLTMND